MKANRDTSIRSDKAQIEKDTSLKPNHQIESLPITISMAHPATDILEVLNSAAASKSKHANVCERIIFQFDYRTPTSR